MQKTTTKLADGRELIYFDAAEGPTDRSSIDLRPLEATTALSEVRRDPVTGDHVTVAAHRQGRTYHPCGRRVPALPVPGRAVERDPGVGLRGGGVREPVPSLALGAAAEVEPDATPLRELAAGVGRCEVVCFTAEHRASFADLSEDQARLVLDAWTDRTAELSALPGVEQVYCFENRGAEIGVTLAHSHGQIYAFPFVTPAPSR